MLKASLRIATCALLAAWLCVSQAQTAEQAHRVGDFYAKADGFSGTILVVRDGTIISNESYGLASVELNVPNTANTRFAIGSITKQFIAAAILLLQEQGLLKTTDTLAQHYPQTPSAWKEITLRQLLQHTSGIPDGMHTWGGAGESLGEPTPQRAVAAVASKPLLFQPGSRMEYNNMGYVLLGLVIENVSKQTLSEFLQQHFFTPLQMHDTGLASSLQVIPHMATGYEPEPNGLQRANLIPFSSIFAAGSIYSTGADLAKWMTALHSGRVLKPASYAEMTTAGPFGYGYALFISKQSDQVDLFHNGRVSGFASQTDFFPETKTGIILLSNRLSHNVSPGEAAAETDLMHLATDPNAVVRSLGGERHIDPTILPRYTGIYIADDANIPPVLIELKDGHLRLTPKGKDPSTLIARDDHEFYVKEAEEETEFLQAPDGSVTLNIFILPTQTALSMKRSSPATK